MLTYEKTYVMSSWLVLIVCAIFMGLLVAVLSYLLLGHPMFHLPGGSLSSGLACGMTWPNKQLKPVWLRAVVGALAGIFGWILFAHYYA